MKTPKQTPSPTPWRLKTRRTACTKTLVCEVVAANGKTVIEEHVDDENGQVYADYKFIVDSVNAMNGGKACARA